MSNLSILSVSPGTREANEAASILTIRDRRIWQNKRGSVVVQVLAAIANRDTASAEDVVKAIEELTFDSRWMTFVHIDDPGEGSLHEQQMYASRGALQLLVRLLAKAKVT